MINLEVNLPYDEVIDVRHEKKFFMKMFQIKNKVWEDFVAIVVNSDLTNH